MLAHKSFPQSLRLVVLGLLSPIVLAALVYGQKEALGNKLAQSTGTPGGRPEDAVMAVRNPDEYAWQLFLALNRQALHSKRGEADSSKPTIKDYDENKSVLWETWALASGGRAGRLRTVPNISEVFRDRGAAPVPWDQLPTETKAFEPMPAKRLEGLLLKVQGQEPSKSQREALLRLQLDQGGFLRPQFDPRLSGSAEGDEVRMNRATYEFVLANTLYNVEGLEDKFNKNVAISFTPEAQEVKAEWVRIRETDKPRYHWRTARNKEGQTEIWGLTGIHFLTRDLPNWFWSDFEHEDYLTRPIHSLGLGLEDERAELNSRDSTTRGENPPAAALDSNGKPRQGVRKETDRTKWQYYRLRGTQIDFTDPSGRPTILANTQIEKGFQQTSSCITCHARATVGLREHRPELPKDRPNSLPVFIAVEPTLVGAIGRPEPSWYIDDRFRRRYLQTDFLWSLPFRALSVNETPPQP